ncbi:hypothetical protein RP726_08990 [Candidatus Methylospira mobilis]|uniref:hypothetical protein n=1 Tax=Candidatus Methylospira mobilis TaxID=1808979 RepID=UPI0028ED12D0|nr:hypothetical protein [Candidatus Methylospira mobilis]WNV06523.1 hypothetical protein RP726_08990 [Candidatus Methylospira mobilis]
MITLGIALYELVQIARPEFTLIGSDYMAHQSNDAYWNGCGGDHYCGGSDERKEERPGDAELTRQRETSYIRVLANERRAGAGKKFDSDIHFPEGGEGRCSLRDLHGNVSAHARMSMAACRDKRRHTANSRDP